MKYFLIEEDDRIINSPRVIGWHNKIDIRNIHPGSAGRLPGRELLFIKENPETIFTDIISNPFFLVSEKVKKVIQMYEPKTIIKELVLLDSKYEKVERYFLPVFEELDCLAKESILNLDHNEIKKAVLIQERLEGHAIFRIAGVGMQYIVGNLEIVESFLKREVIGMSLKELQIIS